MITRLLKVCVLAILMAFTGILSEATGQEAERRFSVTLQGGLTLATYNDAGRLAGGFDASSGYRPIFGGSIQYALSPLWSLEGTFHMGSFENEDDVAFNYTNDYMAFSLRNIINLNQLFQTNRASNYINPYVLVGVGAFMNDVESDAGTYDDTDWNFIGGIGVAFYLSRTLDFFVQYDYNIVMSNRVDGLVLPRRSFESDQFATAQAGLRINFGRANARHSSWRRPPMDIFEDDYNRLMGLGSRIDNLERRSAQQEDEIKRLEQQLTTQTRQLDGIQSTQSDMGTRLTNVESQLANMDERVTDVETRRTRTTGPVPSDDGLVSELADGHYVQIYAALSLSDAQRVRQNAISMIDGMFDNAGDMVLITQRRSFYEVRIGVFDSFSDTVNVLRTAQNTYDDAFVTTFPRPAHLREFYQGMRSAE